MSNYNFVRVYLFLEMVKEKECSENSLSCNGCVKQNGYYKIYHYEIIDVCFALEYL